MERGKDCLHPVGRVPIQSFTCLIDVSLTDRENPTAPASNTLVACKSANLCSELLLEAAGSLYWAKMYCIEFSVMNSNFEH